MIGLHRVLLIFKLASSPRSFLVGSQVSTQNCFVLRENHAAVSAVFPTIAMSGIMKTVDLYDTSTGKAIRIAHAEGKKLDIIDRDAWQKFLDKAFVKKG